MFIHKVLVPVLFLTLISCKDEVSESSLQAPQTTITPISEDKCDNTVSYGGISSVTDITDTTSRVSWDLDPSGIGYILFSGEAEALKVLKTFSSSDTTYNLEGLQAETNYKLLVRTISAKGSLDCNNNVQEFSTTEKNIFISCQDIHEHYQGVKPSGIYEIDTDLSGPEVAIDVYCDMDNNDGGWTRVFTHNTIAGLFVNDAEALETNITDTANDKYSILSKLEEFKKSGKFEFWLHYPETDAANGGNIWTQTSNPATDTISGYVAIRETYIDMHWGGLEKSSYSGTLIDGSVGHSWWFYAIGSNNSWGGNSTIPGPLRSTGINEVQLFVR